MPLVRRSLIGLFLLFHLGAASGASARDRLDEQALRALAQAPASFIDAHVKEGHAFHGLASYYGNVSLYIVDGDGLRQLAEGDSATLAGPQWLAVAGRLNVLVIRMPGLSVSLGAQGPVFDNAQILAGPGPEALLLDKSELAATAPELDRIAYAHLWRPLAWLSRRMEAILVFIQSHGIANWGLAIAAFAVLLKLALLPVGIMTTRLQREGSQVQAMLAPQLAAIKAKYDGEEAHNRMMAAYKQANVSPFYTLKPMLGSLIQIPILIAIFNTLGEMPQFAGHSFLWIDNLAYPDSFGRLPFVVPWIGNDISLLPWVMTAVTVFSSLVYKNRFAPAAELRRQKRNIYLMAFFFLVLFYPFPAAMVLFWAAVNLLQILQQKCFSI